MSLDSGILATLDIAAEKNMEEDDIGEEGQGKEDKQVERIDMDARTLEVSHTQGISFIGEI